MVLALLIITPLVAILFGYLLWKNTMKNYDYNVFGFGVLIRLLVACLVCSFNIYLGIGFFVIFSTWNFIITYKNTSFLIAFLSVIFQPIALFFAVSAINRFISAVND